MNGYEKAVHRGTDIQCPAISGSQSADFLTWKGIQDRVGKIPGEWRQIVRFQPPKPADPLS